MAKGNDGGDRPGTPTPHSGGEKFPRERIRNFSIIAHIDHGKSTLADRLLERTHTISEREQREQFLDKMDLERERGITIKSQTVRLFYEAADGEVYQFNLIDTPGHVDFSYEVSRSLKACEGAVLVVDASQGVEAQTLANVYLALEEDLELLVALNKIDLPAADPDGTLREIEEGIGLEASDAMMISAKEGTGVAELLETLVHRLPPPQGDREAPARALIFDSWYDTYRGVVVMIRVFEGRIGRRSRVRMMQTGDEHDVGEIGVFDPAMHETEELVAGEVGYLISGIKDIRAARVGDTVTDAHHPAEAPLSGFQPAQAMVFSGIFPTSTDQYEPLRDALEKLALNDASLSWEPESSGALGFGFRVGFLGLLHMEIVQERLEREFGLDLITTAPSVIYKVVTRGGSHESSEGDGDENVHWIDNPKHFPAAQDIDRIEEPYVRVTVHVPQEHIGNVLELCEARRGRQTEMTYLSSTSVLVVYELPLAEIVLDFFARLKTASRGYASMDYEFVGYRADDLVRMDLLVNREPVDALSTIVHRSQAERRGRELCERLQEQIPRQHFQVAVQAAVGGKVVARENIRPLRKDVTAKCYGGDITRKRKLLEKQKAGKKRMKNIGSVEIPQSAFMAILKVD